MFWTEGRADSVTGRVTVLSASGFSEALTSWPHVKASLSPSDTQASWLTWETWYDVFFYQDDTHFYSSKTWTDKQRANRSISRGTYTAIMYIQCPFKFKPLDKFSSTCGKKENRFLKKQKKQARLSIYQSIHAVLNSQKLNICWHSNSRLLFFCCCFCTSLNSV